MSRITMAVLFYNHEKYVCEALDGCFNQSMAEYDLIIRDDCSSDNTQKEIENYLVKNEFLKGKLIVDLDTVNKGLIRSLNRVLDLSEGDIIVSQGGDDISMPNRIKKSLEIMENFGVDLVSADAILIDSNSNVIGDSWYKKNNRDPYGKYGSVTQNNCVIIRNPKNLNAYSICYAGFGFAFRKSILGLDGKLPVNLPFEDFYLTFLANVNSGSVVLYEPLVYYRIHGKNMHRKQFVDLDDYVNWQANWISKVIDVVAAQIRYLDSMDKEKKKNIGDVYIESIKRHLKFTIASMEVDRSIMQRKRLKERLEKLTGVLFCSSIGITRKIKIFLKCIAPKLYLNYILKTRVKHLINR